MLHGEQEFFLKKYLSNVFGAELGFFPVFWEKHVFLQIDKTTSVQRYLNSSILSFYKLK